MTFKQCFMMFLAFTLVALFCATGVFADSQPSFADQPIPMLPDGTTNSSTYNSGFFIVNNLSAFSKSNDDVYVFLVESSPGSGYSICAASPTQFATITILSASYSSISGFNNSQLNTLDSSSGLYYRTGGGLGPSVTPLCPVYSSASEGCAAIREQTSPSAFSQQMTIDPGYALRIYSNDSITLQQIVYSVSGSWNYPTISGSASRYNGDRFGLYTNESIVQGSSADRGSFVTWTALNANLFGRASSYSSNFEFPADYILYNSYSYVITNPLYAGEAVQNESAAFNMNTPISVTVYYNALSSSQVFFDLVPLYQSLTASDGVIYYQNTFDLDSGVIHGTITPGEDGDPGSVDFGNPPAGGGNADQPPLSENTTIFGVLSTLTNTITDLFNRAGDAMRSLVQASNSFFTAVIGFFGWLPPEWSAVMWSFFLVLTVLGVVKLFL